MPSPIRLICPRDFTAHRIEEEREASISAVKRNATARPDRPRASEKLLRFPQRHNPVSRFGRRCFTEIRPSVHKLTALFQHVTACIGGLNLIGSMIGKRSLAYIVFKSGTLARPIFET